MIEKWLDNDWISLWGSSKLLANLEDSHIRAARLIHNISTSIPNHAVLSTAKWSSIHYMCKRRLACIAYQAFHNLAPDDINSLFTKHVTSYNFRDNLRLKLKCSKSKALHDSFTHRASIVWNCLPSQFKSKPSYSSSKLALRNSLNALIKFILAPTLLQPIILVTNLCIIDI